MEQLLLKCSTSWLVDQYLQVQVHEPWLPDQARQVVRRIVKRIKMQLQQSHEFGYACRGYGLCHRKFTR